MTNASPGVAVGPQVHRLSHFLAIAASYFAALALFLFRRALLPGTSIAIGHPGLDLPAMIVPFRQFGFDELARGNLALWNPHILCGTPFLGNFQSALLYPPNWLHLVLPMTLAINWGIALHVFLAGIFTAAWCRGRGISTISCLLAGTVFVCGAPFVLEIYDGHQALFDAITWTPLILLATDAIVDRPRVAYVLLGAFAIAMSIFAGHPQMVYYTAMAVGLYVCLRLAKTESRIKILAAIGAMYVIGAALSAVQLLPGIAAASESTRGGGALDFAFAAKIAAFPSDVISLLVPQFFTNDPELFAIGTWRYSFFSGVVAIVLAGCGAVLGKREHRRFSLPLLVIFTILAMGPHTPLFAILFRWLPGFSTHRITLRFALLLCLYLSLLCAAGLDALAASRRAAKFAALGATLFAGAICAFALLIRQQATTAGGGLWYDLLSARVSIDPLTSQAALISAADFAAKQLFRAAIVAFAVGGAIVLRVWFRRAAHVVAALAVAEMLLFARHHIVYTTTERPYPQPWADATNALHGSDKRAMTGIVWGDTGAFSNVSMTRGFDDAAGYDPMFLKRYVEFVYATQHIETADKYFFPPVFIRSPALAMLRCACLLVADDKSVNALELPLPMSRFTLIGDFKVIPQPQQILAAVTDATFNPRETVILEETPNPPPQPPTAGDSASIIREETDELEIRAAVQHPCILLITDSYSSSWRARAFPDSSQQQYRVLPANYTLRAIPLAAGKHHFILEYAPWQFSAGKWITIASLIGFLAACGYQAARWRRNDDADSQSP